MAYQKKTKSFVYNSSFNGYFLLMKNIMVSGLEIYRLKV